MHVLIVGDSHTAALEHGRELLADSGALLEGIDWRVQPLGTGARMNTAFWHEEQGDAVIADPVYRKRLPKLPPDDPRPDAIGLSMPLWSGRVMRALITGDTLPFDLEAPGRRISNALLARIVAVDQQYILGLTRFLAGLGLPVFAIEPPRMFRDYRLLARATPAHALALQARIRALQAEAVKLAGASVVPLPAEVIDADGFMKAEYSHEDPTDTHHANAAFGALRLRQIADFLMADAPTRASAGGLR